MSAAMPLSAAGGVSERRVDSGSSEGPVGTLMAKRARPPPTSGSAVLNGTQAVSKEASPPASPAGRRGLGGFESSPEAEGAGESQSKQSRFNGTTPPRPIPLMTSPDTRPAAVQLLAQPARVQLQPRDLLADDPAFASDMPTPVPVPASPPAAVGAGAHAGADLSQAACSVVLGAQQTLTSSADVAIAGAIAQSGNRAQQTSQASAAMTRSVTHDKDKDVRINGQVTVVGLQTLEYQESRDWKVLMFGIAALVVVLALGVSYIFARRP